MLKNKSGKFFTLEEVSDASSLDLVFGGKTFAEFLESKSGEQPPHTVRSSGQTDLDQPNRASNEVQTPPRAGSNTDRRPKAVIGFQEDKAVALLKKQTTCDVSADFEFLDSYQSEKHFYPDTKQQNFQLLKYCKQHSLDSDNSRSASLSRKSGYSSRSNSTVSKQSQGPLGSRNIIPNKLVQQNQGNKQQEASAHSSQVEQMVKPQQATLQRNNFFYIFQQQPQGFKQECSLEFFNKLLPLLPKSAVEDLNQTIILSIHRQDRCFLLNTQNQYCPYLLLNLSEHIEELKKRGNNSAADALEFAIGDTQKLGCISIEELDIAKKSCFYPLPQQMQNSAQATVQTDLKLYVHRLLSDLGLTTVLPKIEFIDEQYFQVARKSIFDLRKFVKLCGIERKINIQEKDPDIWYTTFQLIYQAIFGSAKTITKVKIQPMKQKTIAQPIQGPKGDAAKQPDKQRPRTPPRIPSQPPMIPSVVHSPLHLKNLQNEKDVAAAVQKEKKLDSFANPLIQPPFVLNIDDQPNQPFILNSGINSFENYSNHEFNSPIFNESLQQPGVSQSLFSKFPPGLAPRGSGTSSHIKGVSVYENQDAYIEMQHEASRSQSKNSQSQTPSDPSRAASKARKKVANEFGICDVIDRLNVVKPRLLEKEFAFLNEYKLDYHPYPDTKEQDLAVLQFCSKHGFDSQSNSQSRQPSRSSSQSDQRKNVQSNQVNPEIKCVPTQSVQVVLHAHNSVLASESQVAAQNAAAFENKTLMKNIPLQKTIHPKPPNVNHVPPKGGFIPQNQANQQGLQASSQNSQVGKVTAMQTAVVQQDSKQPSEPTAAEARAYIRKLLGQ